MLGVAAGGIGYYAAILHIMLHALIKSSLFFQFNQLYRVFQNKSIQYLGNYFAYNSTGAFVMLIGFISISAIPPSGMFVSEFLIIKSLFTHGYIGVLIFVLVLLTYILWAFGRNMFKVLFLPVENFDASTAEKINPLESVTQFLLLGLAIYLGLNPPEWLIFYINQSVALLPDAKLF
jgi:hydrogenase-4 component F